MAGKLKLLHCLRCRIKWDCTKSLMELELSLTLILMLAMSNFNSITWEKQSGCVLKWLIILQISQSTVTICSFDI